MNRIKPIAQLSPEENYANLLTDAKHSVYELTFEDKAAIWKIIQPFLEDSMITALQNLNATWMHDEVLHIFESKILSFSNTIVQFNMKGIYNNVGDLQIAVDDMFVDHKYSCRFRNHSPTGHQIGYNGSGPSQTALSILLVALGSYFALERYQDFKFEYIAPLTTDIDFDIDVIMNLRKS